MYRRMTQTEKCPINNWFLSILFVVSILVWNINAGGNKDKGDVEEKSDKDQAGKQGAQNSKTTTAAAPAGGDAESDDAEASDSPESDAGDSGSERSDADMSVSANAFFIALMALLAVKISISMKSR